MSRPYRPRRAGARWLQDAPEYVLDCFDDGGKSIDRYTILFGGSLFDASAGTYGRVQYLAMNDGPAHPQGFSQWGELTVPDAAAYRYRSGKERVRWLDLPEHIRRHVVARATA